MNMGDIDRAAANADVSGLEPFEGREVRRTTIEVTNAGDGLSKALKIQPKVLHHDETVFVVLECQVAKVRYEPLDPKKPEGPLSRVHTLRAGVATIVDGSLVEEQIEAQREAIILAIEESKGIQRLNLEVVQNEDDDEIDEDAEFPAPWREGDEGEPPSE